MLDQARLMGGSDAGLVLMSTRVEDAPVRTFCFYVQAHPGAAVEAVHSMRGSSPSRVIGAIGGDTAVLVERESEVRLVLAEAGRTRRFRSELDGEAAVPIAAYEDGVVLRQNAPPALVFVPWTEQDVAVERRVELASEESTPEQDARICRAGDRLVWVAERLHIFDLATGERRAHDVGASPSWVPRLVACDDEVALLRAGVVLETGAPLPARLADDAVAVRHRYAYLVRAAPTSRVAYDLLRQDLESADGAVPVARFGSGQPVALRSGLYFHEGGSSWRRFDWTTRE